MIINILTFFLCKSGIVRYKHSKGEDLACFDISKTGEGFIAHDPLCPIPISKLVKVGKLQAQ